MLCWSLHRSEFIFVLNENKLFATLFFLTYSFSFGLSKCMPQRWASWSRSRNREKHFSKGNLTQILGRQGWGPVGSKVLCCMQTVCCILMPLFFPCYTTLQRCMNFFKRRGLKLRGIYLSYLSSFPDSRILSWFGRHNFSLWRSVLRCPASLESSCTRYLWTQWLLCGHKGMSEPSAFTR